MSYGGAWRGSGQLPARAVERGQVSRFGSIDPDEGGYTSRHQAFVQYKLRPSDTASSRRSPTSASTASTCSPTSRSTCAIPTTATRSSRSIAAPSTRRVSYRSSTSWAAFASTPPSAATAQRRHPRRAPQLAPSHRALEGRGQQRPLDVHRRLRERGDHAGEVASHERRRPRRHVAFASTQANPGAARGTPPRPRRQRAAVQPKASVASPRSRAIRRRSTSTELRPRLPLQRRARRLRDAEDHALTRAIGEEIGSRARLFDRWESGGRVLAARSPQRDGLDRRRGTTEVGEATTRKGVELETRFELTKWLAPIST